MRIVFIPNGDVLGGDPEPEPAQRPIAPPVDDALPGVDEQPAGRGVSDSGSGTPIIVTAASPNASATPMRATAPPNSATSAAASGGPTIVAMT